MNTAKMIYKQAWRLCRLVANLSIDAWRTYPRHIYIEERNRLLNIPAGMKALDSLVARGKLDVLELARHRRLRMYVRNGIRERSSRIQHKLP